MNGYRFLVTKRKLFLGDYSDNFALVKDVDSGTYTINVTKPLETELLNTQPDIILTLQAKTDDVEGVGTATLVIRLPKTEVLVPAVFSSTVYKANYSEDGPTVSSDTIELTGDNQDSTVVTLSTSGRKIVLYQKKTFCLNIFCRLLFILQTINISSIHIRFTSTTR